MSGRCRNISLNPERTGSNFRSQNKFRIRTRQEKLKFVYQNIPNGNHKRLENEDQLRIARGPDETTGFQKGREGNYRRGIEKISGIRRQPFCVSKEKAHIRGLTMRQKTGIRMGKTEANERTSRMGNNDKYMMEAFLQIQAERNELKQERDYLLQCRTNLEKKLELKEVTHGRLSNQISSLNNDISSLQNTFVGQLRLMQTEFTQELQTIKKDIACKQDSIRKVCNVKCPCSQNKLRFSLNPDAPVHVPSSSIHRISKKDKPQSSLNPDAPVHVPASSPFWPQDDFADTAECMTTIENNADTVKQEVTEEDLVKLIANILALHGRVSIGKMGSLLHKAANDHTLPALMKQRYGGLKKFLQSHSMKFVVDDDHPYNPHVELHAGVSNKSIPMPKVHIKSSVPLTQPSPGSLRSETHKKIKAPVPQTGLILSEAKNMTNVLKSNRLTSSGQSMDVYAELSPFTNPSGFVALVCKVLSLGLDPKRTFFARICIVGFNGQVVYDKYAKLCDNDEDFHCTNNISSEMVTKAINASVLRDEVIAFLTGKVIIGYSVASHLNVLALNTTESLPSPHMIRDIASYSKLCPAQPLPLSTLIMERLGVELNNEDNDLVTDARAILAIYKSVAKEWEEEVFRNLIMTSTVQTQPSSKKQIPQR